MQPFELTVLGCSSATPTSTRNPTSQLLNIAQQYFLIDCGEGTQMQLRKFKVKFQRINHIFISHLHGDHFLGLAGLLASMHLLGRTADLYLYAAPELKELIELQHKYSLTTLRYNIIFCPLQYDAEYLIFENEQITVESFPLYHRIPCCGFLFKEKRHLKNLNVEKLKEYNIPRSLLLELKKGENYITPEGKLINNEELTTVPSEPRSYAYCSDTIYDERIVPYVKEVNLLYHEATFMHDMLSRAKETFHTTTIEAATIAQKANVKQLLIGHYSARYKKLDPLLHEAQSVFPNTLLAEEGKVYSVINP